MNLISLSLIAVVFVIILANFSLNFFGKKLLKNYFFWAIPSVAIVIYFVVFRFTQDWINLSNYLSNNFVGGIYNMFPQYIYEGSYNYSLIFSKALLLDLCPFVALALPLSLIFDKTRKIATIISPFAIFGGLITLFGGILFDANANWSVEYLFVGAKGNEVYFFMHAYLLIAGVFVLSNSNNTKKSFFIWIHIFAIIFFVYITSIAYTKNVNWNVTGIVPNDWLRNGEYYTVTQIFNLGFPYIVYLSYFLVYAFIIIISLINYYWNISKIKRNLKKSITLYPKNI